VALRKLSSISFHVKFHVTKKSEVEKFYGNIDGMVIQMVSITVELFFDHGFTEEVKLLRSNSKKLLVAVRFTRVPNTPFLQI
jgi:hypothetical protein